VYFRVTEDGQRFLLMKINIRRVILLIRAKKLKTFILSIDFKTIN